MENYCVLSRLKECRETIVGETYETDARVINGKVIDSVLNEMKLVRFVVVQ